jgi:hypothetical protein
LQASCRIGLCVTVAVLRHAYSIVEHKPRPTLRTCVPTKRHTPTNLRNTLAIRVQRIPLPTFSTYLRNTITHTPIPTQPLHIIKPRTTLRTHHPTKPTTVVYHTLSVNVQLVPWGTAQTFP